MRVPCRDGTSMLGQRPAFESRLSPKPARAFLMIYFVYILISQKDNSFYIGQTNNIDDRLKRHNAGQERYTKTKVPWKLFWFIQVPSRSEAMRLERNIKNFKSMNGTVDFNSCKRTLRDTLSMSCGCRAGTARACSAKGRHSSPVFHPSPQGLF